MPTKDNRPFSAHGAAQTIRKKQASDRSAAGMPATSYTQKQTPQPSRPQGNGGKLTFGKIGRAITAAADTIGLDLKPGFQNTFGSVKGVGKMKSKK